MSENIVNDDEIILVTGASGFLASHIVKLLLEKGYRVRGTIRSLKDEKRMNFLKCLTNNSKYEIELYEANLDDEESILNAVKGCSYVIHTASPIPNYVPKDENDIIQPAVNGTLSVLKGSVQKDSKIKRLVLTSSIATIAGSFYENKVYSENDFSEPKNETPYIKSKILAEKAVWDFVNKRKENNESCFDLVVINPGFIVGPILYENFASSLEVAKRLMNREMIMLPDISLPGCDVRDCALAHVKALSLNEVISKRHIIVANNEAETMQDYAFWLEEEFKSKGYNISTRLAPNFLLKIIGYFSSVLSFVVPMLGKRPKFNNYRFKNVLKIEPINPKKTIIDMAYSMIEFGFIPKKTNTV